jgi:ABC-type uncharacterized transport system ATPase subunit
METSPSRRTCEQVLRSTYAYGRKRRRKSTLSKIIAGVGQSESTELYWKEEKLEILPPLIARRLGIGIVFQELDVFPNLSVVENLVIGNARAEQARRPLNCAR